MKRELVFTGFNRPNYLREAIASWNQAGGIQNWDASFSLEPSDVESQMISEFEQLRSKTLTGEVNSTRFGVLVNPFAAMKRSFARGSDFSVLAEDDIIVSSDVLEYFEWASEEYKEDESVLAILAYSRITSENDPQNRSGVARTKVFCPLVWGTWRHRWEFPIEPNWDLNYSSGRPDGSEAGWDWNMMRLAVRRGEDFIYPTDSRSNHIGLYGGTHTSPESFPESQAYTFRSNHYRDEQFKEVYVRDWKLNDFYPGSN